MASNPAPAAEYLRKSTEHQKYSIENQSAAIRDYAERQGFVIVRTYADPAKSGLSLRQRPGLQQLLKDVAGGEQEYRAILVYDVSRWGRFQDTDEAAHYEFVCKEAGIPVHYCAEVFANDRSLPSSIMKALKRAMAGEYSRELGVKVVEGQKRMAARGFKQGGFPGYGFRRMLISADGERRQVLERGQRKSLATDRVILVPGPRHEVQTVREIFRKFTTESMSLKDIARDLNRRGVPSPEGKAWGHSVIAHVLRHPKYIGWNVFNRNTQRLGSASRPLPKSEWVLCPGAHEPLVDEKTFALAQQMIDGWTIVKKDEELLQALRLLLAEKGMLSARIIDEAPDAPCARTYWYRFGSLRRAEELVGYDWLEGRRRGTNAEALEQLRSILRVDGVLSAKIIDKAGRGLFSQRLKRRFGKLSRAYELIGYDWRANLTRARTRSCES